jgi:RNA polymerase sigma factor (sigma-70 family)
MPYAEDTHMFAESTTSNDTPGTAVNVAEIADRYTSMLYGIGRRYRLTPEECDDAAQSTWLALCQNTDRIRDPHRIPGWLATTMRRSASTTIRRRHREQAASHLLTTDACIVVDTADDIADTVAARHATIRLYQAIDELPARERRLIWLQLDPTEPGYACISRTLPIPIGSIGPVRGRALRRLRTLLHDLE